MQIQRREIALCILFSILTCGIYTLYWMYKLNEEVNFLAGRTNGTDSGLVIVFSLITCGIYELYWLYKMGETVEEIRVRGGRPNGSSNIVYLVLGLFQLGIVSMALMQSEVNEALIR